MPAKKRNIAAKKKHGFGRTDRPIELTLPSIDPESGEHNVCLVKRPGPQGLVSMGILDSLDSLTSLVSKDHLGDTDIPKSTEALKDLAGKDRELQDALNLMDKVLAACAVDPPVSLPPSDGEERDPEALYADDVDFEDKSFILQWVMGGTGDWERFRKESAELMDGMEAGQSLPLPAE
jgi:hypothetical protein